MNMKSRKVVPIVLMLILGLGLTACSKPVEVETGKPDIVEKENGDDKVMTSEELVKDEAELTIAYDKYLQSDKGKEVIKNLGTISKLEGKYTEHAISWDEVLVGSVIDNDELYFKLFESEFTYGDDVIKLPAMMVIKNGEVLSVQHQATYTSLESFKQMIEEKQLDGTEYLDEEAFDEWIVNTLKEDVEDEVEEVDSEDE